MPNAIQYAAIFQQELDKKFPQTALTGWMEENTNNAKYMGGKEIKIPSVTMQGLGDYDRNGGGAPEGDITLTYQTVQMTRDRGRGFTLDEMDINETNFALEMGGVMGDYQREHVVPEVDAYRLSQLVKLAGPTRQRTYTPAAASVLQELTNDILAVRDKIGYGAELALHISTAAYAVLINSDKLSRQLNVGDFKHGEINQRVRMIDNVPLLPTPNGLMKTAFDWKDGKTPGQEAGGFTPNASAKDINWIVCARKAPLAPCKQDAVRVFNPNTWQKSRSWHADYRKYWDLWVPTNKLDGIFSNIGA